MLKNFTILKKSRLLLLTAFALITGSGSAWAQQSLPYSYGFEGGTTLSDGWTLNNVANNNALYVKVSTNSAKTGTYGYQLSSYNGGTANQLLISPELVAPNGVVVSFAYKSSNKGSYGTETFKVGYSTTDTDPASFTWGDDINENSATWKTFEEIYPAGTKYVAVNYISSNKYYLYVDDFIFEPNETYKKPKNFAQDSWTSTSATFSWTAGSTEEAWQIVYSTDTDFDPNDVSPVDVTTNPYTLTGLTAETTYYACIRANYGENNFSSWSDKLTFIASAAVELTINDGTKTSNYLPFYGYKANAASNHGQFIIPSTSLTSVTDNSITRLTFYNSSANVDFGTVAYKVYLKEVVNVEYGSAELEDWAEMTEVYSGSVIVSGNKMEIIFDAPFTYDGGNLMIGFYQTAIGTASAYADSWIGITPSEYTGVYSYLYSGTPYYYRTQFLPKTTITYLPVVTSTPKPKSLATANITNNSVQLSWTSEATKFNIQYKAEGDADWTTINNVTANPYTLTGLSATTYYQVKVQADFGLDGTSDYTNAISFTTKVAPINAYPYTENFNTLSSGEIPAYWDNSEGTTTTASYKWVYYATGHDGACVQFDSYNNSNGNTNFLKTRPFSFTEGQAMKLSFWYKNPKGGDFSVYVSTDGGETYPTALSTGLTGQTDWKQEEITIPAAVFGNNVVIVFKGTSNWASGDAYIYLDDVVVSELSAYAMSISGSDVVSNTIAFGSVKNTTTTKTFTINNDGSSPLTGVSVVSSDAEVFTVSETGFDIAVGGHKDITITFVKGVAGDYDETITVSQANVSPDLTLAVTGTYVEPTPATIAVKLDGSDVGASVAFGTVGKQKHKTFTVTNTGETTLSITSIASDNTADFTVSPSTLEVAQDETKEFTVTFLYDAEALDAEKTANITVTPSNAGLDPIVFAVTGTRTDMWSEDFEGGTMPTGWDNTGFVVKTGTVGSYPTYNLDSYMAVGNGGSSNKTLITPLLKATIGDKLTFDGFFYYGDETFVVDYSTDLSDWNNLYTYDKTSYTSGSIHNIEIESEITGEFYLRFTVNYYNAIDNIEGFKLAPKKEHEAVIAAKSIPATGNQYVEYSATVTVKEKAGKDDEAVTAELWIGTTKVATENETLTANGDKLISLSYTPNAAISGDAYIKVYNADNSIDLTSDVQAVTIAAALVLDETAAPGELTTGSKPSMVLKYTPKNGWNTICVPFALTTDIMNELFGADWKAYEFKSYSAETGLHFENTTTFYAGYPYLVYVETAATHADGIKLFGTSIGQTSAKSDTHSGVTFQGTYAPMAAGTLDGKYVLGTQNGATKLYKATASTTMKGFRAYFEASAGARLTIVLDDEVSGIATIENGELQMENVYNMQGQKVNNMNHKGLYIVNGKKTVIR